MNDDDRHPVEVLAEEFADRLRRGESPTIDEYIERLPEHRDTIRQVLAPILAIERVSDDELTERQFETRTTRLVRQHTLLGDFRIERQVGRGGMGIVYEATQQSLGRRVALKVLSPDVAGSTDELRRFRMEAATFAKLHHTNIVPIFGIGEAEGLHFYAMQFIDGVTLADVIAQRSRMQPSQKTADKKVADKKLLDLKAASVELTAPGAEWLGDGAAFFRNVAQLGHDVADALAHAHHHGIIHRDIKPSNLMLDSSTVWVTDFGIAKQTGDATQTRTGLLLGTLRYMAPEQFSGHADARSDVYSLGLTLYELIAGQPAFPVATHATLIKTKLHQAPPPLRSSRPDVPKELETIVLKACATEATARYPSAAALAEDLQRFLDDRPILARRATTVERMSRWARRNPAVAGLSFAVFASLAALAVVFATGNYRLSRTLEDLQLAKRRADQNLSEKAAALGVAEQQRLLAANNLAMAIEAFDEIMRNIGSRGGVEALSVELNDGEVAYGASVVTNADAEMLHTLLTFFDRFSQENATELLAQTANANHRVGEILFQLGRIDEAEVAYLQALKQLEQLETRPAPEEVSSRSAEAANPAKVVVERMQVLTALGLTVGARGAFDDSQQYFRRVAELYESAPLAAQSSDVRFEHARALNLRNSSWTRLGLPPSRMLAREAMETRKRTPLDGAARRVRTAVAGGVAKVVHRESKALNAEAIAILTPLVAEHPKRVDFALELAHAYREQARLARNELDPREAQEAFRATIDLLERLMREHPSSPYLKFVFADTITSMAPLPNRRAGPLLQRALQIANTLVRQYPTVPDYAALKAKALLMRGDVENVRDSVQLMEALVEDYPAIVHYRVLLSSGYQQLASFELEAERKAVAKEYLQTALHVLESSADGNERSAILSIHIDRLKKQLQELNAKESGR